MFRRATSPRHLSLVTGGRERSTQLKGVSKMNLDKFAESSVASAVTLLVSAWFMVAAGAILADPTSPYTQRPVAQARSAPSIVVAEKAAPVVVAGGTIIVEAKRLAPAVVVAETIVVEAKRLKA
jgi:hypothetical protein